MKKNLKYILLLILFLIPVRVFANSDVGNNSSCTIKDESRLSQQTIRVKVGETFQISCNGGLSSLDISCREDFGTNNSNFCLPKTGINTPDGTATFEQVSFSSGKYTFKALNIGNNDFFCDHGTNRCYKIIVTDEQGRTYSDIVQESLPEEEPTVSIPLSETRPGYDCYLMCQDASCRYKFLFYTNRDMSGITGFNGTTARTNVFSEGTDGTVKTLYSRNRSRISAMNVNSLIIESGFEDAQLGNISPMQCAAAGAVFTATGGSEPYDLLIEESSGTPGVYQVFDEVLLFGSGFKLIMPGEFFADSSNPYDPYEGPAMIRQGDDLRPRTEDAISANICPHGYMDINTEEDFIDCYQCTGSSSQLQNTGSTCNNGLYTIGVMPEPDNVSNEIDDGTDPNDVVDGTVTGIVDSEAGLYNWTCEDVKYTTFIYNILRLIAPFLLIIFASLDYFKAVVAGDIKKQQEARVKAPKRLIAFLLLLLIPFIVSWMFKAFGGYGSNVMTAFCCVATNGNPNCSIGSSGSGTPTPTTPTNTSQVDEVTADNLCNGNNYLSPNKITTVCSVKDCINNRYGECLSTNIDDGICNKCEYTPLSISKDLCTSNCGVGYKSGQCFFNMVKGVSTSSINNLSNSGLTLIKKVHQSGTTGDYHDGYFNYDRKIKENVTQTVCTSELKGTPYDCDSSGNSCSCLYGNSIISGN